MTLSGALGAFFSIAETVGHTALDALFPLHPAEREALAMDETRMFAEFPRAPSAPIPEACSAFWYKDERVSRLIWSIKYRRSRRGSALAAYALYRIIGSMAGVMPAGMRLAVVPMPITRARRRERGFNQCELVMDEMRKLHAERGKPDTEGRGGHGTDIIFARDLLLRVRHTSRQTHKDRQERLASIQGIFAVNERSAALAEMRKDPAGYFIVIIDDVITTGSTMRDAVGTLRHAGFERTYGLSLAH